MWPAQPRGPHVVETVEHCDQVEPGLANLLGRCCFEANPVAQPPSKLKKSGFESATVCPATLFW